MKIITNAVLAERIENVKNLVEQGFLGVHTRQDMANGTLSKHETRIQNLENTNTLSDEYEKKSNRKFYFSITILGFAIAAITFILTKIVK